MIDPATLRQDFPALGQKVEGRTPVFLDGPAGTQVPRSVIDAMVRYLTTSNANAGGAFTTSRRSDAVTRRAHEAVADLLHAPSPDEVIFGPNMTTLAFHLARAFARTLRPGDQVLVTRMDHDANVRPWVQAAGDAGAEAHFVDIVPEDCTLDLGDLRAKLNPRVKLLAVTCASNAVGTINNVREVCSLAHGVGARVFLDAVHYAAHGPIDVQHWGCDFLACSAYKFFGPHVGILWGKRELLESWTPDKVRPASDDLPSRWMTGTPNFEGLAGVAAAVDYLASLAETRTGGGTPALSRRERIVSGLGAIQTHETTLARRLLAGLAARPRFRVWGIADETRLSWRVPTVAITSEKHRADEIARHLADREIYVWSGNMYAIELTERLGVEGRGGLVRLGLIHYNLPEEVDRLLDALDELPV